MVSFPVGTCLRCHQADSEVQHQYLHQPVDEQFADIYWGRLEPETPEHTSILSAFLRWKPWISSLEPYVSPTDSPHVTLFCDRIQPDWYQEKFELLIDTTQWDIKTKDIYVAPGVVAEVLLTLDQTGWFMMGDEGAPHVSLTLHPQYQAKELEGILKRALSQTDWVYTSIPEVRYSAAARTYRITVSAKDTVLEHLQIARHHGREKSEKSSTPGC